MTKLDDDLPWDGIAPDPATDIPERPTYTEICGKCGGTGQVCIGWTYRRFVTCYACKGKGKFERKTSPEARQRARTNAAARKARTIEQNLETFAHAHPEVSAWLEESAPTFEFAASLRESVRKFGTLTDRQLAACQSAIEKRKAAQAARQARIEAAPEVQVDRIGESFATARANGIKRPSMTLGDFRISMAPDTGRNAGSLYVKSGDVYLGKITSGKFYASRECTPEQSAAVIAACADPLAAAVAHGKRTGNCAICNRELTNAESIERGIGPICAERFGW